MFCVGDLSLKKHYKVVSSWLNHQHSGMYQEHHSDLQAGAVTMTWYTVSLHSRIDTSGCLPNFFWDKYLIMKKVQSLDTPHLLGLVDSFMSGLYPLINALFSLNELPCWEYTWWPRRNYNFPAIWLFDLTQRTACLHCCQRDLNYVKHVFYKYITIILNKQESQSRNVYNEK